MVGFGWVFEDFGEFRRVLFGWLVVLGWFWGGLVGWCGGGEVEVDCRISEFSCTWGGGNSFSARDPRGFWVFRGAFRGLRVFLFRDPPLFISVLVARPTPLSGGVDCYRDPPTPRWSWRVDRLRVEFERFDPRPSVATENSFRDPCRQRVDVGGGRGTKVGGSRVEPPI